MTAGHGKALCWAARIVTTAIGAWLALHAAMTFLIFVLPRNYEMDLHDPWLTLIWCIPLLLAAVAWRWHLVGGVLLVLSTVVFVTYYILRPPYEPFTFYFVMFPPVMAILTGGLLHIVAWWKERCGG